MSTRLTKALAVVPPMAISVVLWFVLLAVLPPQVAVAVADVVVAGALLLVCGAGERGPGRWVMGARRLRAEETAALAEITTRLCRVQLGPPLVELLVTRHPGIAAQGTGRRTVVLTSGLLDAVRDGVLPPEQATAVLAHAAGVVRSGLVRSDLALRWVTLPYAALAAVATVVSWPLRRVGVVRVVWRWRAVLIAVAGVQQASQGRYVLAAVIVGIGALSYAVPAWQRAWSALLVRTGDRCVVDVGYDTALTAFLRRCPATDATRTRLRALTVATGQPVPVLGLVRS